MAGVRLLRELLRDRGVLFRHQPHLPRPVAAFSRCIHEQERRFPFDDQVRYLHAGTDDQERGVPLLGTPTGFTDSSKRETASPHLLLGALFRSCKNFHVGLPAHSMVSHIRGGGRPKHLCHIGCAPIQLGRHCSTVPGVQLEGELPGIGGNAEVLNAASAEVAEKLASTDVQAISEVSAIIGDCSYPTAFVQILMDSMHTYFGLPWWGAIVATTLGIRLLCLPIVAYQTKTTAKLSLIKPRIEKINERIKASNYDPEVSSEGRVEMMALFKEYKTNPLAPFAGAILQAPVFISFFFAIQNMCERLESFKHGGLLLFTDLAAKDTTFILPVTLSAVMLLTVELNAADGMEGNPYTAHMKTGLRAFSLVLLPISMNFEIALFFYWIPSNLFSLFQSFLFKHKAVKEFVGIPSTEQLAAALAPQIPEEAALPEKSTKDSVKKKLTLGRGKLKGSRRR